MTIPNTATCGSQYKAKFCTAHRARFYSSFKMLWLQFISGRKFVSLKNCIACMKIKPLIPGTKGNHFIYISHTLLWCPCGTQIIICGLDVACKRLFVSTPFTSSPCQQCRETGISIKTLITFSVSTPIFAYWYSDIKTVPFICLY